MLIISNSTHPWKTHGTNYFPKQVNLFFFFSFSLNVQLLLIEEDGGKTVKNNAHKPYNNYSLSRDVERKKVLYYFELLKIMLILIEEKYECSIKLLDHHYIYI